MALWLGNQTENSMTYTAAELFGFGVGSYEQKIVRGGVRDVSGLAWRLSSDLQLVCYNKKLMPLCGLLHLLATGQGLGDVGVEEHVLSPKLHPVVPQPN